MDEQLANKAFFLGVMNNIMREKKELRKIIFSYDSPHAEYTHPWIRIMIPIEKQLEVSISQDHKMINIQLSPGEILFCLTNGAFSHQSRPCGLITIIYWNELIRFLYESEDAFWYHTNNPVCEAGRAVLKALSLLADEDNLQIKISYLLNALMHITYEELDMDIPHEHSKSYKTFQNVLNYISYNFHKPINRQLAAETLKITPQHLSRLFKMHSRFGFNMIVKKMRLNHAVELLNSKEYSVNEVAERSGFINVGYFITEFKKAFGSTPGKYP